MSDVNRSVTGKSESPRFSIESINPALGSEPGEAFQTFSFELLRRTRPGLRRYPTGGKDGGIDLVEDREPGRGIFECKYIGKDGLPAAISRWRVVERNLLKNLPARSPRQYSPWWDVEHPIVAYTFCISSTLANQAQVDKLKTIIGQVFRFLGESHAHLAHLKEIEVKVQHWPDLAAELGEAPDLLFRWFPQSRPLGLVPIDSSPPRGPFSSFLDSATLGYYSRDEHVASNGVPRGVEIETEATMLERLSHAVGLVITGAGGHGKTRLVQELGWLAHHEGWCVLRISGSWRKESLERLGEQIPPATKVLLLADYIETQQGFVEAVHDLVDIDETYGMQIKYIANCRSSFYPRVAHLPRHDEIPLSPENGDEWFRDFRHAVVRHILVKGGVEPDSHALEVCRDVPVIAVFLVYLLATGRTDDLRELLNQRDFAAWVRGRIGRSFPHTEAGDVASMIAQFPMSEAVAQGLTQVEILSTLERDGWIERQPAIEDNRDVLDWVVVHDVLADQLLTAWLAEQGSFAAQQVRGLLSMAVDNKTLASTLSSLQRVRDQAEIENLPMSAILREEFARSPQDWVAQIPHLVGSSLLEPLDAVAMLEAGGEIWSSQLSTRGFRHQIGWLARQVSMDAPDPEPGRAVLRWLERGLAVEETDYLLRSGLVLSPATTASRARSWIEARPGDFATHFVMTAWLEAGLPSADIDESVRTWLGIHGSHSRSWHLLASWLTMGGDTALVEPYVVQWLDLHRSALVPSSVVITRWLKARGSLAVIDRHALAWLQENGDQKNGSHVLSSWIERGADLEAARPLLERWLKSNGRLFEAGFVISSWLHNGGDVAVIEPDAKVWLDEHGDKPEAMLVFGALVRALPKTPEAAASLRERSGSDETHLEFGQVLGAWLTGGGSPDLIQPYLSGWLARFGSSREAGYVYISWYDQTVPPVEVREASLRWFREFPTDPFAGVLSKRFVLGDTVDAETVRAILRWCIAFPADPDALWRLTQLKVNLSLEELSDLTVEAVEAVAAVALDEPDLSDVRSTQLTTLFSFLARAKSFRTGIIASRFDDVLVAWLRHPHSFQHGESLSNAERLTFLRRMLSLVLRGLMDLEGDAPALARMLGWVASWEATRLASARRIVDQVAALRPGGEAVWEIVRDRPEDPGPERGGLDLSMN